MSQLMQANGPMWQIDSNDIDIEPHANGVVTTASNGTQRTAVPTVQDVIGSALKHVGPYKQLDNSKQVVALIDDVSHFSSCYYRQFNLKCALFALIEGFF